MAVEDLYTLAEDTLHRLRQIRGAVLEEKPEYFAGKALEDAEQLVDGLTGVALLKWGTSNAGLNKSIESLNDLLSDTASRWGDLYACTARGINNGTDLISWMKTIAWNQNPWQILMRNNKQDENRKPAEHDMVVSPLATGPILIRLAQRKSSLNLQVAMAVVDDLSTWDVRKGLKREVYLSQKTSWPKGELKPAESGFTWVLDDSRTLGDTVSGLVKKLKQLPGLESRLIY